MSRFEVFTGPPGKSVLIGLVDAVSSEEAIEALERRRSSPGAVEGHSVGTAFVEWVHPNLYRLGGSPAQTWRAVQANGPTPTGAKES